MLSHIRRRKKLESSQAFVCARRPSFHFTIEPPHRTLGSADADDTPLIMRLSSSYFFQHYRRIDIKDYRMRAKHKCSQQALGKGERLPSPSGRACIFARSSTYVSSKHFMSGVASRYSPDDFKEPRFICQYHSPSMRCRLRRAGPRCKIWASPDFP